MVVRSFAKPEEELKSLKRQLIKFGVVDSVAYVAMGLGLFALFVDSAEKLHPILGKSGVGVGLLVCGVVVATIAMPKILQLTREIKKLERTLADAG